MNVKITKGTDRDHIEILRRNGSVTNTTFPKKGLIPHDAIHLIVERELQFKTAFWGRVFDSAEPREVSALSKAGGHASSSRAGIPDPGIVELLQAERIVECFEAELWGGSTDSDTFRCVLNAACSQSKTDCPTLTDKNLERIRTDLQQFMARWQSTAIGASLEL